MESEERVSARWKLAGVFALTLGTTGVRCGPQGSRCVALSLAYERLARLAGVVALTVGATGVRWGDGGQQRWLTG